MLSFSSACAVITGAIALYFAFAFGLDAEQILSSPIFGLEDPALAKTVFSAGHLLDLSPNGLLLFAARLGALKLAIAIMFVLAVVDKLRLLFRCESDNAVLEAGLILVIALSLAGMNTALLEGGHEMASRHGLQLALAVLAGALSIADRLGRRENKARRSELHRATLQAAADASAPLPPVRNNVMALRWNLLRRWANPVVD